MNDTSSMAQSTDLELNKIMSPKGYWREESSLNRGMYGVYLCVALDLTGQLLEDRGRGVVSVLYCQLSGCKPRVWRRS